MYSFQKKEEEEEEKAQEERCKLTINKICAGRSFINEKKKMKNLFVLINPSVAMGLKEFRPWQNLIHT